MLRLLLLGLIGVAAYRIGSEFFRTIPSDFEPVRSPADQGQGDSELRGSDAGNH